VQSSRLSRPSSGDGRSSRKPSLDDTQVLTWCTDDDVTELPEPRKGDRPAFEKEALHHFGDLRKLSFRLTRNRADADDLVQDAYLRAFRGFELFTTGTNLRAWLQTILRNVARNRWRDQHRARVLTHEAEAAGTTEIRAPGDTSPEQVLLDQVMAPRLQQALESMPKELRDAVWLRDVEELSYAEIAERLRIPAGTVMSRISRGRHQLHDRLIELERLQNVREAK
jgi:RNA polymerase sigma-70 factor (ECF subfamily)